MAERGLTKTTLKCERHIRGGFVAKENSKKPSKSQVTGKRRKKRATMVWSQTSGRRIPSGVPGGVGLIERREAEASRK